MQFKLAECRSWGWRCSRNRVCVTPAWRRAAVSPVQLPPKGPCLRPLCAPAPCAQVFELALREPLLPGFLRLLHLGECAEALARLGFQTAHDLAYLEASFVSGCIWKFSSHDLTQIRGEFVRFFSWSPPPIAGCHIPSAGVKSGAYV